LKLCVIHVNWKSPWGSYNGLQVAQVTGIDGFVHLIWKLAEKATASAAGSPEVFWTQAARGIVNYCLENLYLESAVTLGFERAKSAGVEVERFASWLFPEGNRPLGLVPALEASKGDALRHLGVCTVCRMKVAKGAFRLCLPLPLLTFLWYTGVVKTILYYWMVTRNTVILSAAQYALDSFSVHRTQKSAPLTVAQPIW
jgi:hypothetical protein